MYSDGLKKVRYIKLLYKAFCSLFAWGLQTPREKGIWTISSQVLFLLPNNYLTIKIEKVQRLGGCVNIIILYTSSHECQSLTIKSLLNLD